jgi:hypothetical protein
VTPWRNRQCHHRGAFLKVIGDALYLRGSAGFREFLRPRARALEGKAQGFRQFSGVAISFKTSNPLIFLDSRIRS